MSFFRRGAVPSHVNAVHNDQTLDDDRIQFARLLAELDSHLTGKQRKSLSRATGLQLEDLDGLFERARQEWGKTIEQTYPDGFYPQIEQHQFMLDEFGAYQPNPDDAMPFMAISVPHQVEFEFNYEVGAAALSIRPDAIELGKPEALNVGVTIQDRRPQLYITTEAGDAILLTVDDDNHLVQLDVPAAESETEEGV